MQVELEDDNELFMQMLLAQVEKAPKWQHGGSLLGR
jgi:hypothetical protein